MKEIEFYTHKFVLGELYIETSFIDNGDRKTDGSSTFTHQKIILNANGNSASINLYDTQLTPEMLRELANRLDKAKIEAGFKLENVIEKEKNFEDIIEDHGT